MDDMGLWVSPAVLVPGVGLLILSTSARYGQIHGELRELIRDTRDGTLTREAGKQLYGHLHTRTRLLLSALFSLYISIGLFITGSLVGALNAVWAIPHVPVIALTCGGILGVAFAALQLIRESRLFLSTVDLCVNSVIGPLPDTADTDHPT